MSAIALGGASGAVAASTHAACARFRGTDPLITGQARRQLAASLGHPDTSGTIPEARWVRAMTFEALVHNKEFAARVATTAIGSLRLARPKAVVIERADQDVEATAALLAAARDRAKSDEAVTLIHTPAVPYPDFAEADATPVLPDFLVVARRSDGPDGAWVIVGDAKDYERVRSKIDDERLLKGFIQVAFGAEALDRWDGLPQGMAVHEWGVLAVPRNAFLQPTAITEDLTDHRTEVRMRLEQRRAEAEVIAWTGNAASFVAHLAATFDPSTCPSCSLFAYCRKELRQSADPGDLLIEIGLPDEARQLMVEAVRGNTEPPIETPASAAALWRATATGRAVPTGQLRLDPAGSAGTVNVVLVKSDTAALGVHGIALQVIDESGKAEWQTETFDVPQADSTRRAVMKMVGVALRQALGNPDVGDEGQEEPDDMPPVHLVVPDRATADLLASIADTVAGVELSRLRWVQDQNAGREPLTFDGLPATIPPSLDDDARLGVSFLLEEDRARAFRLRVPVVDVREALVRLFTPGGASGSAGRLDYVVGWAATLGGDTIADHRAFADAIEVRLHTPGARLSTRLSNDVFAALTGGKSGKAAADLGGYRQLVADALEYRMRTLDEALSALEQFGRSRLADAVRAIEYDAQAVWQRRWRLRAYDLIRFGLTTRYWRNTLVDVIETDAKAHDQMLALTNPQWADEKARQPGRRELAIANVVSTTPLELEVNSRRMRAGDRVVALHVNGEAQVERVGTSLTLQKGSIKIGGLGVAALEHPGGDAPKNRFRWAPATPPGVSVGDVLVVADADSWFSTTYGRFINIARPQADKQMSPKSTCSADSYAQDPDGHKWCCRPHVVREAEIADDAAQRRSAGELNPEVWPPVLDADAFDVTARTDETIETIAVVPIPQPAGVTMDDLE